jgi:PKD repeat protein
MRRLIFINTLLVMILASAFSLFAIEVDPPKGPYYECDKITFTPSDFYFSYVDYSVWNFGDGTTIQVTDAAASVEHSYSQSGSYSVIVEGYYSGDSVPNVSEKHSIQIESRNRYIQVSPPDPIVGQPATFTAYNFGTPENIRWDMGDGTILGTSKMKKSRPGALKRGRDRGFMDGSITGTSVVTHTYSAAGNYTVRAYDCDGQSPTAVIYRVTVKMPERIITHSPAVPLAGAPVQFNAVNFLSSLIDWNFGDGTTITGGNVSVTHVFSEAKAYKVTARESNSDYPPVEITVVVQEPNRSINLWPRSPRVDQPVYFEARDFITNSIDWNFGDGAIMTGAGTTVTHRYQESRTYTVSAKDSSINHTPVTITFSVAPENRYIVVSPPEVRTNETVTVTAFNFRGDYILWDFGDGTQRSGLHTETHQYRRAGTYIISAQDENGESQKKFTQQIIVKGIDDQVNLEIAEVRLDNGKYYKIVPKNSKNIRAILRMKMRGTGIVSGRWIVDGSPFELFSEVARQGTIKEIYTRTIPGLPTVTPGIHTITVELTRPEDIPVTFPVLKYFVLPYENLIETLTPPDGFIAKEKEIPEFSWKEPRLASKYQVAFSNYLYSFMGEGQVISWIDVKTQLKYTPGLETWNRIKRNRWTYWKVRALDTNNNVVAESDIHDIKVVIATAEISVDKVTDLEGNEIPISSSGVTTSTDDLLVHGSIEYKGDSEFLVLRVYVDNELMDQLLFRDVKKNEKRYFETSIPNKKKISRIQFKVLKTSSPAVIIGIKGLILRR